jgi:universal stress protein A
MLGADGNMSFTKVMAAVDWDEASAAVVIETARRAAGGRPVEIVHVLDQGYYLNTIDPASASIEDLRAKASSEAEAYLQGLCDRHGGTYALLEGHAATMLHEHAESGGHDLLVVGSHGRHGLKLLLGSTANAVLHGTNQHVLAVRIPGRGEEAEEFSHAYRRLIACVDLTDESSQVLDMAQTLASEHGAEMHVAHVIKPLQQAYAGVNPSTMSDVGIQFEHEADAQARDELARIADVHGLAADRLHVGHGAPAAEIHALVKELGADLVVIGTHGKHGVQLLLGSTANATLHGATCDTLAVRIR